MRRANTSGNESGRRVRIGELQGRIAHLEGMVQELKLSVANADAANCAKSEFLARMSHELRTPLHAIKSFTSLVLKKSADLLDGLGQIEEPGMRSYLAENLHLDRESWDRQAHFWLTRIQENQERQLGLINNLLDLVKLESGKTEFCFCLGDLSVTIQGSVEELETLFVDKSIQPILLVGKLSTEVVLDHERIRGVIKNLLGNALKFTPLGGSVVLSLEEGHMEGYPALVLQVRDTGPGIPEPYLNAIFQPFAQVAQEGAGSGGTGLGLAICREIVTAHGGTIAAANHPDGGAIFTVCLPRMEYATTGQESTLCTP
ncbi:MAG: HAMP domain-containing histidine kinase [Magnetococcus sp. YQC-3]